MSKKFFAGFIITLIFASCAFAADLDKVVARVNSQDITEREVLLFLQPFGQQALMLYQSPQGRKMVLDDVISLRLFSLEGEKAKLDQTQEFKDAIESTRRAMLAQAAMRELLKDIKVDESEAKKFYDENKQSFMQPERVHAKHILISGDADELAAKIISDLKAGASFDVLAREYSQDPGSKNNGGDLGEFPHGIMVPEFDKAAFSLEKPGDISEPVKTQFGIHIIKLEEKFPESPAPFEQVKDRIIQELREQKTQEILKARSEELEKIYKVERF